VRDLPIVRAVYDAMHVSRLPAHHRGVGAERNHRLLCEALSVAGVELGAYDRRIVEWLAGWEPSAVVVVCGFISRAAPAARDGAR
jgi:hypothetical protein